MKIKHKIILYPIVNKLIDIVGFTTTILLLVGIFEKPIFILFAGIPLLILIFIYLFIYCVLLIKHK